MTNSPGDLTGKIANHYHNLKYLEKGGIKPSSVVFMANGVNVVQGKGVVMDFTRFTGLIETTKPHLENDSWISPLPLNLQRRVMLQECQKTQDLDL
ncbi:hypothetical protein DAPPUDRAFT_329703 [Daphnia pulex]|uniref:Uncharacterized protein n=1 Tax=Daphnia pulex TaxID=6669 RepID=E9HHD5_DAPPU|nr:hypothetical protein DAPPUDRAFT_329703 [Daphnia pulex]|eukprot:EFX68861.1 hypothetical protein DAPPUDRAFT_329703 [Daphnia pulex]